MADVVNDTFNEAGVTNINLETHVPNLGTGWEIIENPNAAPSLQVLVADDCARTPITTVNTRIAYASAPNPASPEYDVEFILPLSTTAVSAPGPSYLIARWVDANNYYSAGGYSPGAGGGVRIYKKVAGVVTQLATGATNLAVGDVITFRVRNASKSLWVNGVQVLSTADNALTAAGRAGFGAGNAWLATDGIRGGWRWDNYSVFEYPLAVTGEITQLAVGQGTTAATSAPFTPVPGTVLLAVGIGRELNTVVPAPLIANTGTALTWVQAGNSTGWNNTAGTNTRMKSWLALVPPTVSPTAVTITFGGGVQASLCAIYEVQGGTTNVLQYAAAAFDTPAGAINFATPPSDTSLIIAIDGFAGVADLAASGTFVTAGEPTGTAGGVNLGMGVAYTLNRTSTLIGFPVNYTAGAAGGGCVIGIEMQLSLGVSPAGSGTGRLDLRPTLDSVGAGARSGTAALLVGVEILPGGIAEFDDTDLVIQLRLGGFGGLTFVPVVDPPDPFQQGGRAIYEVSVQMTANSRWLLTNNVRAVTIDRRLAIWPDELEAGTCDVVLDDASGIYSPLQKIAHGGGFRPNLVLNVLANHIPLSDDIVRSYWLFRGLIDSIDVNPSIEERTVNLRCRDAWKVLHDVQISTSMMVDYNVGSVLSVIFDAASITQSQRSIDVTADVLPFASYRRSVLADAVGEFIDGGGYAAYVAADGVFRIRNKYFDIGGENVSSYYQMSGLNYSFTDEGIVNRLNVVGQPRYHVQSRQVVGRLDQMVTVPGSSQIDFGIDFFDPRNNDPAGARNGLQPRTSSGDWFLNTSSSGLGTDISATGSMRVTFFGDGVNVRLFNGNGATGYLTKLQLMGEPILDSADVSVQYEVASSTAIYGVRDRRMTSRLFSTQPLIDVRATDIIEQFAGPHPVVRLTAIDDFPGAFLADLGRVVGVKNEHLGLDGEQFTIYGLSHEIRADDVGPVHQMTLDLRLARQGIDVFLLDSSHLDVDRLGR